MRNERNSRLHPFRTPRRGCPLLAAAHPHHGGHTAIGTTTQTRQDEHNANTGGQMGYLTAVRLEVEENQLVSVFGEIGILFDGLKGA